MWWVGGVNRQFIVSGIFSHFVEKEDVENERTSCRYKDPNKLIKSSLALGDLVPTLVAFSSKQSLPRQTFHVFGPFIPSSGICWCDQYCSDYNIVFNELLTGTGVVLHVCFATGKYCHIW